MSKPRVGIVGVGRMGSNIGRRLREQGYTLSVVADASADLAAQVATELAADVTQQLARVTELSDVIITVVDNDESMRDIYLGDGDSLFKGARGKTYINCATVSPSVHVEIEKFAEKAAAASLEACMAGSIPQARDGKLFLMCGGRREVFDANRELIAALSATSMYCGPAGHAAMVKALVNMVMNINTAGLAEGLGLGDGLGLDLTILREVFAKTGAASRVLETDGEDMQNRAHDTYFSAAHAAKDSGIALTLAHNLNLTLPLAEATKAQYDRMVQAGLGELDKSGIAELTFLSRRGAGSDLS